MRALAPFLLSICGCGADTFERRGDAAPVSIDAPLGDVSETGAEKADAAVAEAGDGCDGILRFFDSDHDGFGGSSMSTCASGSDWTTATGDCDDANADVHPGQTSWFAVGYTPTGMTTISFDYDCDGKETESAATPKANCQAMGLSCVGSGYVPATPVRSGASVDPYCGSASAIVCSVQLLVCKAGPPQPAMAIACR